MQKLTGIFGLVLFLTIGGPAQRVEEGARSTIGDAEGVDQRHAAPFFFFFFKPNN